MTLRSLFKTSGKKWDYCPRHHRHCLPLHGNPILAARHAQLAAPRRDLPCQERRTPQLLLPIGRQRAVRRACDRVLRYPNPGREVARDEIHSGVFTAGGDDQPVTRLGQQQGMVRLDRQHIRLAGSFYEVILPTPPGEQHRDAPPAPG